MIYILLTEFDVRSLSLAVLCSMRLRLRSSDSGRARIHAKKGQIAISVISCVINSYVFNMLELMRMFNIDLRLSKRWS